MDTQPDDKKAGLLDMRSKENKDLLLKAKDRTETMMQADHENRVAGMSDLKFVNVPGYQWQKNMKEQRGTRPCYEFNKLRIACKRVINDMRANRPGAKVRAVEDGDKEQADMREGLLRNIWAMSDGDTVIDYAAEYQTSSGMGAWRVNTRYTHEDAFNQEIYIEPIRNPFTLYCDPQARDFLKRDARDWVVTERIAQDVYEKRWPGAELSEFTVADQQFDDEQEWTDEKTVRIAEYWYQKPIKKEIWQVSMPQEPAADGSPMPNNIKVVDSTTDEAEGIDPQFILKRREINTNKICYCIVSGQRVLEKGEWAGTQFPFIMVFGEYAWIDGRPYWWGLPRFAKDAQRSYNIARTSISETIAQAPKTHFWATERQSEGHLAQWQQAHKKNYPFMLYNSDPKSPGVPQRMGGADVPIALIQETQMASDEIKAVTGIFDASVGASGNETSGVAIARRQNQGEIATFNFQDNMSKGVQRTYEIMLDLLPHIYDTEREMRVLGSDGAEDYQRINEVVEDSEGNIVRINDLAAGKYDVTVTQGPSFSTLRQEAAETYGQLAQQFPEIMGIAGDLVMKSMDLPYAEDIAERMTHLLPPAIQQQLQEGKEIPPEVAQMMAQAEQAMAQVEEMAVAMKEEQEQLAVDQAASKEAQHQAAQSAKDVEIRIERLRRTRAEFDSFVTAKMADLETAAESQEPDEAVVTIATGLRSLDDTVAAFMETVDAEIGNLRNASTRMPVSSKPVREGGKLYSEMSYEDGETVRIEVQNPDD